MKPSDKKEEKAKGVAYTVALFGNPNVGKSTLFNALTGMRQHTGNWTGKTVSGAYGYYEGEKETVKIVDLPGTYSLSAHSEEERVANEYLASGEADVVVVVCDATCLMRNLALAMQIIVREPRTVVCLNLMDEAKRKGIEIDREMLSHRLGVPVVDTVARDKKSTKRLMEAVSTARKEERTVRKTEGMEKNDERLRWAEEIYRECVRIKKEDYAKRDRAWDRVLTGKKSGYLVMILLLLLVFWVSIVGANYPSEALSRLFGWLEEKFTSGLSAIGAPEALVGALAEGVFRVTGWVISVMLPPMAIFFPCFSLLEDVGYLPRVAYNLDRPFCRCKACGKQALTMCMGFGCNAAGVTGCRIIDSPRERLLAILTNSFVPCNGRFPLFITLFTVFFVGASGSVGASFKAAMGLTGIILLGIFVTFLVTRILSETLLRGMPSSFTLELPPYRKPKVGEVLLRSFLDRTLFVLGRAASVAAPAGLLIWVLANLSVGGENLLTVFAVHLDPFAHLLGLDGAILLAFILALPANEIVIPLILMIYLSQGSLSEATNIWEMKNVFLSNGWTAETALCVMLFSLMHWPCSTTLWTVKKEAGGWRYAALAAAIPTVAGMFICMLTHGIFTLIF